MFAIALLGACDRAEPVATSSANDAPSPHYVGVQRCGECHDAAFAFWNNTRHARAFFTLASIDKHGDASCVGCHVTGFGEPGGHSSSRPRGREAVQCEVCHGPGSQHAATESLAAIVAKPGRALCVSCHRPPHVPGSWDVDAAWRDILGPGHGRPIAAAPR